jgi:hypothetical protein
MMNVIVVSSDAEERWAVVGALALPPNAGFAPDVATAWIEHPTKTVVDVVVVTCHTGRDVAWIDWHRSASTRTDMTILAVTDDPVIAAAADLAGADKIVMLCGSHDQAVHELRAAVAGVFAPIVITLDDPAMHSA